MTSNSLNIKNCVEKDVLEWFLDNGIDEAVSTSPVDKTAVGKPPISNVTIDNVKQQSQAATPPPAQVQPAVSAEDLAAEPLMGTAQALIEAKQRAADAKSLEELRATIQSFEGLAVKKTAMNMVFCDGSPEADIMVIGEAPGADEDRQGKPFVGASGQLLDKVFSRIGLSRTAENAKNGLYISNILNWRPPGNRTPTPDEMRIAQPFIERHIQLAQPKILVLVGNTPMKSILNTKEGIKKMRGQWHNYETVTAELPKLDQKIIAMPTFHPAFLLRNPGEKKTVWQDMIMIQEKRKDLGLL